MFKLQLEDDTTVSTPSASQIADALAKLDGQRNTFAILEGPDGFVQSSTDGELFDLEYADEGGGGGDNLRCTNDRLSRERVIEVFQKYAMKDPTWKSGLEFKPLESSNRRGCLPALLLLAALPPVLWAWLG